jgi:hypothetical protein
MRSCSNGPIRVLRAERTREPGVEWGPIDRGVAEIVGVPKEVRQEFSTRRRSSRPSSTLAKAPPG